MGEFNTPTEKPLRFLIFTVAGRDLTGSRRVRTNLPRDSSCTSKRSPGCAAGRTTRFLASAVTVIVGLSHHVHILASVPDVINSLRKDEDAVVALRLAGNDSVCHAIVGAVAFVWWAE